MPSSAESFSPLDTFSSWIFPRSATVSAGLSTAAAASSSRGVLELPTSAGRASSSYSVLEVLTPDERASRSVLGNISYHRPANATLLARLGPQAIPRRIMQTGRTFHEALATHGEWMRAWMDLNPECAPARP